MLKFDNQNISSASNVSTKTCRQCGGRGILPLPSSRVTSSITETMICPKCHGVGVEIIKR